MRTPGINQNSNHALFVFLIEHIRIKPYNYGDHLHEKSVHPRLGSTLRKKNIQIKEYFFDSNKWLSWMVTNKYFFRSKKYFYCL